MNMNRTRNRIRESLETASRELDLWCFESPELLSYPPRSGWSALQILEHVSLTNHYLLILIRKGTKKALERAAQAGEPENRPEDGTHLDPLDEIASHGAFRWDCPAHMEPAGGKPPGEIREELKKQFGECAGHLEELRSGQGTLHLTMMSVGSLGRIDVYQYMYFLCLHAQRHLAQLERVRKEYLAAHFA
ncbi:MULTISPECIES: DinB family protein [Paenibacillus]|uniref:DinB family protein n=1 Tax=Paenibacillus TaxID=44249 RepID=UPI0022B8B99B|nr:DinB family protein [Paenibacillus caseinilyticus]MCZ8520462.1 DinB family protein [Paenibacillus caseinilyticus]